MKKPPKKKGKSAAPDKKKHKGKKRALDKKKKRKGNKATRGTKNQKRRTTGEADVSGSVWFRYQQPTSK